MYRIVAVLLLLSPCLLGQSKPKIATACRVQLKQATDARDSLSADYLKLQAQNDALQKENERLRGENDELSKKYTATRKVAQDMLDFSKGLVDRYEQSEKDNDSLREKYNDLLGAAKDAIAEANRRLARQQQINNALALYGVMQRKQQPYQIPPPPQLTQPINCTSSTIGTTTYTECR